MATRHRTKESSEKARKRLSSSAAYSSVYFSERMATAHRLPGEGWYVMSNVTRRFK